MPNVESVAAPAWLCQDNRQARGELDDTVFVHGPRLGVQDHLRATAGRPYAEDDRFIQPAAWRGSQKV